MAEDGDKRTDGEAKRVVHTYPLIRVSIQVFVDKCTFVLTTSQHLSDTDLQGTT